MRRKQPFPPRSPRPAGAKPPRKVSAPPRRPGWPRPAVPPRMLDIGLHTDHTARHSSTPGVGRLQVQNIPGKGRHLDPRGPLPGGQSRRRTLGHRGEVPKPTVNHEQDRRQAGRLGRPRCKRRSTLPPADDAEPTPTYGANRQPNPVEYLCCSVCNNGPGKQVGIKLFQPRLLESFPPARSHPCWNISRFWLYWWHSAGVRLSKAGGRVADSSLLSQAWSGTMTRIPRARRVGGCPAHGFIAMLSLVLAAGIGAPAWAGVITVFSDNFQADPIGSLPGVPVVGLPWQLSQSVSGGLFDHLRSAAWGQRPGVRTRSERSRHARLPGDAVADQRQWEPESHLSV